MKKTVSILSLLFLINIAFAQQDAQISHYMFNNVVFNPAYAGMNDEVCINLVSHQQWMTYEGAPLTNLLTVDSNVKLLGHKGGVGLKILDDRVGFVQNFNATGMFAYHRDIGLGTISVGIDLGVFNKLFDPTWSFPDQTEDILTKDSRRLVFDMGSGLFYRVNNLSIGFSSSHLIRPKFNFETENTGGSASEIFLTNHYYGTVAYNIQLANAFIDLTPSLLLKSDGVSVQPDINVMLLYNKKFWTGVTYRNEDAFVFFAGTSVFNNLKIGLSYDLTLSRIRTVSTGTFEAYVGFCFSLGQNPDFSRHGDVKDF